jgi:hypothetical protein
MRDPQLQSYVHQLTSRPEKQVFRTGPLYKGRAFAMDKDSRWQCDIIDNIKDPAQQGDKTYRYVLLCVDVFTRYAWAEPMETRGEAAIAFARILQRAMENNHQPPTVLSTDKDAVFTGRAFQLKLREHDIVHVLKQSREDIAVVDRLISTVRRALAVNVKAGDENWVERLDEVIQGYNESPHRKLFGQAPVDISRPVRGPTRISSKGADPGEAQRSAIFDLRYQAATDMKRNETLIDDRKRKLEAARGFRILVKRLLLNRRVYRETWSDEIHLVHRFDQSGALVQDTTGHWYPTKDVLPVRTVHEIPSDPEDLAPDEPKAPRPKRITTWSDFFKPKPAPRRPLSDQILEAMERLRQLEDGDLDEYRKAKELLDRLIARTPTRIGAALRTAARERLRRPKAPPPPPPTSMPPAGEAFAEWLAHNAITSEEGDKRAEATRGYLDSARWRLRKANPGDPEIERLNRLSLRILKRRAEYEARRRGMNLPELDEDELELRHALAQKEVLGRMLHKALQARAIANEEELNAAKERERNLEQQILDRRKKGATQAEVDQLYNERIRIVRRIEEYLAARGRPKYKPWGLPKRPVL